VRGTASTVECLYRGDRVASHPRSYVRGRHTSIDAHRPQAHRQFAAWTPQHIIRWASTVGPETANAVERVMQNRKHPELGFRAALGIIRLGTRFGNDRVERACERARQLESLSYRIPGEADRSLRRSPVPTAPSRVLGPRFARTPVRAGRGRGARVGAQFYEVDQRGGESATVRSTESTESQHRCQNAAPAERADARELLMTLLMLSCRVWRGNSPAEWLHEGKSRQSSP
jgi:hypothetical protein